MATDSVPVFVTNFHFIIKETLSNALYAKIFPVITNPTIHFSVQKHVP